MFQALLIEKDQEWLDKLEEALFSMNFECLVATSEDAARSYIEKRGKSIGIIFACLDKERLDGMAAAAIQYNLGFYRPIIGITNKSSQTGNRRERLDINGLLGPEIKQMDLRNMIDRIFWEHHEAVRNRSRTPIVLIVEDDDMQSSLLVSRLIKTGVEPYVAVNGLKGLEEVKRLSPQLIIMDINMPIMDGFTLVRLLKDSRVTKNIPVIGVSASASETECLRAGCDLFFVKPYSKKLISKIKDLLSEMAQAS